MITLHFQLQPQYKYEFHIYFSSFHCTERYEINKLTSLPMCGFTAQLVEHRTGVAEVTGSNPVDSICHHIAHVVQTATKQVILRRGKNENVCEVSKNEKCLCKACEAIVFYLQICKFVTFLLPLSSWLLKLPIYA